MYSLSSSTRQVLPRTHKAGPVTHVARDDDDACIRYIADPARVDAATRGAGGVAPVTLELDAGMLSLHDPMLLHGSERNRSARRRAGVALTYMPAECHFNRHVPTAGAVEGGIKLDFSTRPLLVVKGENQNPKNELVRSVVRG